MKKIFSSIFIVLFALILVSMVFPDIVNPDSEPTDMLVEGFEYLDGLADFAYDVFEFIKDIIVWFGDTFKPVLDLISNEWTKIFEWVDTDVKPLLTDFGTWFVDFVEWFADILKPVFTWLSDTYKTAFDGIAKAIDSVEGFVEDIAEWVEGIFGVVSDGETTTEPEAPIV